MSFHISATMQLLWSSGQSAVLQVSRSKVQFSGMDLHCTPSTLLTNVLFTYVFFIDFWYGIVWYGIVYSGINS